MSAEGTAFHESGHAVAAHRLLGASAIRSVSVISADDSAGHTLYSRHPTDVEASAIIKLAGDLAERRAGWPGLGGTLDLQRAQADARELADVEGVRALIGSQVCGRMMRNAIEREGVQRYATRRELERLQRKAEQLVEAHWHEIEVVATALLRLQSLTGTQVCSLIETGRLPATTPKRTPTAPASKAKPFKVCDHTRGHYVQLTRQQMTEWERTRSANPRWTFDQILAAVHPQEVTT